MKHLIDRLLRRYDNAPYLLRSKARFLLYLSLLVMVIVPVAIIYTAYLQILDPRTQFSIFIPVLVPSFSIVAVTVAAIILLVRGRFSISAHLLMATILVCSWVVMLVDPADIVSRLDTISLIIAALTILPLVVLREKPAIPLYVAANIAALFGFMFYYRQDMRLEQNAFWDYLADNTLALVIAAIVLYNIYAINQRAIARAEEEIADRRRAEEEGAALQQQLFRSQKLESLGMLAGGIAHDFNNMLSVIIGYADMLKLDLSAQPEALDQIDRINEAALRSREMTRQLLTFARRQPLEMKPVELNALVADFGNMITRLLRSDIVVDIRAAGSAAIARADAGQIAQVLMNLVLNAQDAMPGPGRIVIETGERLIDPQIADRHAGCLPGRYHLLRVSDTGNGIPSELVGKIFDPFFTTKAPGAGTGLGLSIVYGIVAQHGGFVEVASEPGTGSVFSVYLPDAE